MLITFTIMQLVLLGPIKKFRSDLPNISARNAIAGHFSLKPKFAETFLPRQGV